MQQDRRTHLIGWIRRLVCADVSFQQVIDLSDHLLEIKLTKSDPIYAPCLTGIVVTYMQPFVKSGDLGMLSEEFCKFSNPLFQRTHDMLKESRHAIYAHRFPEATKLQKYVNNGTAEPYRVEVELKKGEAPTYHFSAYAFPAEMGYTVRELCVFQRSRVAEKLVKVQNELTTGKQYRAGRYILGDDFP